MLGLLRGTLAGLTDMTDDDLRGPTTGWPASIASSLRPALMGFGGACRRPARPSTPQGRKVPYLRPPGRPARGDDLGAGDGGDVSDRTPDDRRSDHATFRRGQSHEETKSGAPRRARSRRRAVLSSPPTWLRSQCREPAREAQTILRVARSGARHPLFIVVFYRSGCAALPQASANCRASAFSGFVSKSGTAKIHPERPV